MKPFLHFLQRNGLVILALFLVCPAVAQHSVHRWTVNDGLSQNSVTSICQDREGRLWVGTADGLNWFDGRSFRTFQFITEAEEHQPSNFIVDEIHEEKDGRLIYATKDGVYRFDPSTSRFTRIRFAYDTQYGLPNDVRLGGWDAQGRMYFNDGLGTVYRLEPGAEEASEVWKNPVTYVYFAHHIDGERLFVASYFGMFILDLPSGQIDSLDYSWSSSDQLNCFTKINGQCWLATNTGVYSLDADSGKLLRKWEHIFPDGGQIRCILPPSERTRGLVWVGTNTEGVYGIDAATGEVRYRYSPATHSGIQPAAVIALEIDEMGNLWIGYDGVGLSMVDLQPSPFGVYRSGEPAGLHLPMNYVRCLGHTGDEWLIAPLREGLWAYDSSKDESQRWSLPGTEDPAELAVQYVLRDQQDRLWIGSEKQVWVTGSDGVHRLVPFSDGGQHGARQILALQRGLILVANDRGFWYYHERTHQLEPIEQRYTLWWLYEDVDGSLWSSAYYGMVYRLRLEEKTEGHYRLIRTDSLLDQYNVRCYADDPHRGWLWMASEKGLIAYDRDQGIQYTYTTRDGLANDFIYNVFIDDHHRIWCTSNKGLSRVEPESGRIRNYGLEDGLQSLEFNARAIHRLPDGRLMLGGTNGFNVFDPTAVADRMQVPRPFITLWTNQGVAMPLGPGSGEPIEFRYDGTDLFIAYSNSDYAHPHSSRTAFRLVGRDTAWTITAQGGDVRFSGLSAGTYALELKAMNADGLWSEPVRVLHFTVLAPYWQRWWFIGGLFLLVAMIAALVATRINRARYRARLAHLERQREIQSIRLQISRDIHDDIGSGLSRIVLMTEMQRRGKDESFSERIASTARELTSQLGHIVWSLNPENDRFEQVWLYIRHECGRFFDHTDVQLDFSIDETAKAIVLDPRQRVNLIRVVRETLNNIIKYASADKVRVAVTVEEGSLVIVIADNGVGFAEGTLLGQGNGMRNMRKRMEEIGGSCVVDSAPGKGTRVTLRLPYQRATT